MVTLRKLLGRKKPKRSKEEKQAARMAQAMEDALTAERVAVDAGLAAFRAEQNDAKKSSALLRRNVHRIEKGLCIPGPRKAVFAEKYIAETTKLYRMLSHQPSAEKEELKWAHDVLQTYFDVVDTSSEIVERAKTDWDAASPLSFDAQTSYTPYAVQDLAGYVGSELSKLPDLEAYHALCRARRSQRWFEEAPVPMHLIEEAAACALQAPSACNRQPFRFIAAQSRDMVKSITDLPLGTAGFGEALPMVVAVVGNLSMYAHPRDRHLIFIDAGLASMAFMQGLTAAGLGSVPINWPDIPENHDALRELVGLAPYEVPVMLIGIGRPKSESKIPFSAKRPVHEVLHVID
ncbi:nitroreductase family protein [Primorskyibacter sp. S187A]|uniref:nitroreductase family protein n=1 Tax=Primorskyibacter sp. S187A TaxID=3415130 RepID=UPI003C7BC996